MEHGNTFSSSRLITLAGLGGIIGALCVYAMLVLSGRVPPNTPISKPAQFVSETPGLDYLDDYRCPGGETKIIRINGVEDGYARGNDEPARPHERLMHSPYFQDHVNDTITPMGARDYDERGTDKRLIDHFTIPPRVNSGELVFRMKPAGSIATDSVYLADYLGAMNDQANRAGFEYIFPYPFASGAPHIQQVGPEGDAIYKMPLESLMNPGDHKKSKPFLQHIHDIQSDIVVDIIIQDDGIVDFVALALCQKPSIQRGTTLSEFSDPSFIANLSFLQCSRDLTQRQCDGIAGDHVCSTKLPLACYKEGNKSPPQSLIDSKRTANYVGGEVKTTPPIRGDQFDIVDSANAYCRSAFGKDWRVLSFHESGGATVVSHSQIPPKTRVWVDVKTNPYANCWGRKDEGQP